MPILTDKHCETKVRNRTKFYDEGPGAIKNFYVDVLPSGVATFCFKKPYVRIGVYRPADHLDAFTVQEARIAAAKSRLGLIAARTYRRRPSAIRPRSKSAKV